MTGTVRLDELDPASAGARDMFLPVMKDGEAYKLTVGQLLDILIIGVSADYDTWPELVAAVESAVTTVSGFSTALAGKASLTGAETLDLKTLTSPRGEFLRGLSRGCAISNNASFPNDRIDIAAGMSASDGTTPALMIGAALTKRLDATFVVGNNNGGLDAGSKANSTWYYTFMIQRSDTGVTDYVFSTSKSSPTLPANYDRKARLPLAIRTDGSGNIRAFRQYGRRRLEFAARIDDVSVNAPGAGSVNRTVSVPPGMLGVFEMQITAADYVEISNPDQASIVPSSTSGTTFVTNGRGSTRMSASVSASSQLRVYMDSGAGNFYLSTIGFEDWEF